MMLSERIEADYLAAYRSRDLLRVGVLRLLKTAAKNLQVELMRPLTEEELIAVVQKQAKQRQDSMEQFSAAGRDELARKEADELRVLQAYLPEPLSPEALAAAVDAAIEATGATDMAGMGKVIQAVLAEYKGRTDGKLVSAMVRQRLQAGK